MLCAYCVRRAGEPGPGEGLTGVNGSRVELLEEGELGLWVSRGAAGPPTLERLRDHDRVVRAALRSATPLPIRYGTNFADARRAVQVLREQHGRFVDTLERVSGCVEMGIRVLWQPPQTGEGARPAGMDLPAHAGPGRAYLESRRRERMEHQQLRASAEALLDEVEQFFQILVVRATRGVLPEAGVAGTLAHLVHRNDLRRYRERVEQAPNEFFPIRLQVSGPWAPYSFV